jgi:hypothetical protein
VNDRKNKGYEPVLEIDRRTHRSCSGLTLTYGADKWVASAANPCRSAVDRRRVRAGAVPVA